jgi:Fic family protein
MRGRYVHRIWHSNPTIYAPARYRKACAYDAFVPDPVSDLELSLPGDVAGVVSEAEKAITDLNNSAERTLRPLARLLLRTESIASSRVEGMQVDARTLARAEANQDTGRRVGAEAAEILANVEAMQTAVERAVSADAVTVQDLEEIHRVLLSRSGNYKIAGVVRDSQSWIGGNDHNPCGADFVPAPPEDVAPLLSDLCRFTNDNVLPPLAQAAVAHAQFETIHPFHDGNGRTGRALVQVILRRRGLAFNFAPPISVVLANDRDRYIRGLTLFREGEVAKWVEVFASAAAQAALLASRYVGRVSLLQDQWRDQLRHGVSTPRADAAAWALIDVLPAHPIITVAVAVAATGRHKSSLVVAVDQLEAAGVLVGLSQSPRNRAWEASGLLDLIVELEAGAG